MIGRVDLIPRTGGDAVLGYWLDERHMGQGYATEACRAVIGFGRRTLDVSDVWAGVTKGNVRSERLLARLGFEVVADMGSYTRFHRFLAGPMPEIASGSASGQDRSVGSQDTPSR